MNLFTRPLANLERSYKYGVKNGVYLGLASVMALSLSGCFHSEDDEEMITVATYKVTVSNLTNGQPMTPVAMVLHKAGYEAWTLGGTATSGLEKLAESGDTTDFIAEAEANMNVLTTDVAGSAPFGPGETAMLNLTANHSGDLQLSVASMLANTNDAYTGVTSVDIGALAVGDSMVMLAHVFDAGTEANTEASGSIAGPVDSSTAVDKAYSATRDDLQDFVTVHAGVVSMDDGLSSSILGEEHRWNGVAAKIQIERL